MSRHRKDLGAAARRIMEAAGFEPELPPPARQQLAAIESLPEPPAVGAALEDRRGLPWSSIDNRETRDVDQIEVAEELEGGATRILVAVADVDVYVARQTPLDLHAAANTTSVYVAGQVYPMLPEVLSTDRTSLHSGEDRVALVVETVVAPDGTTSGGRVYRAWVRNRVQLDYDRVGRWLAGRGQAPEEIADDEELQRQLHLQDAAAERLRARRYLRGALELETIEAEPVVEDGQVVRLEVTRKTRARDLIEDFMIAANVVIAEYLENHDVSWIRRMVGTPERWPRIAEVAARHGGQLPDQPDASALAAFLRAARQQHPDTFPDISLAIVKLLGSGEYVVERRGEDLVGHFALAVQDYTHFTAPNRRFADLVTQRLVKAVLAGSPTVYADDELVAIARRCTHMEDEERRVERRVRKLAAIRLIAHRVGQRFPAIVTGASPKGTYVRLLDPPVEGRVMRGEHGMDVGDHVRVRLIATDPDRGYIDFARAN